MDGFIGDRLLKHFLKGIHRASKSDSSSKAKTLRESAAEKVVCGSISNGASNDIQRASELTRRMVMEFGMSDKLGTVRYATQQYQFLSGETSASASPSTLKMIDEEVQRIITEQYERAQTLLMGHRAALETVTQKSLKTETIDGTVIKEALLDTEKVKKE